VLDGDDVTRVDPVQLRRRTGYVIQQVGLFPHQRVWENVATVPSLLGWDKARRRARADELLELVGLDPAVYRDRWPAQLSGGQRQRVGVARALAADPPVLLMDEPFSAIDPIARDRLQSEFLRVQEQVRKTILFVTHDVDEAVRLGDRIAVFRQGGVLEQYDTPATVLGTPASPFVADFVGADRGLRRLAVTGIDTADLEKPPVVALDDPLPAARAALTAAGARFALVHDVARPAARLRSPRTGLDGARGTGRPTGCGGWPAPAVPVRRTLPAAMAELAMKHAAGQGGRAPSPRTRPLPRRAPPSSPARRPAPLRTTDAPTACTRGPPPPAGAGPPVRTGWPGLAGWPAFAPPQRPAPGPPAPAVRVVELAGSARRRTPAWCWPTSAPTSCASTARRRLRRLGVRPAHPLPAARRRWTSSARGAPRSCCGWPTARTCSSRACGPGSPSGSASARDGACARNERLVYARMTGWGQDGPARAAGRHDLDYLAITGRLSAVGEPGGAPVPPLNLVRRLRRRLDAARRGVLAALVERATSGRGRSSTPRWSTASAPCWR
jgi:osmoprotectant transport system ATP-binding protein